MEIKFLTENLLKVSHGPSVGESGATVKISTAYLMFAPVSMNAAELHTKALEARNREGEEQP